MGYTTSLPLTGFSFLAYTAVGIAVLVTGIIVKIIAKHKS